MPILDIQKRARELGRIRLGQKGDKGQPQKLDRFRFTGHSHALLTKIAELYGGDVVEWTPAGGTQQWEVVSNTARVPIMVPPQPVSQWYESWSRAGCQHRCDGRTNVLTDEPCDPEDPKHIEATKRPTTRLNVVLRDVEGIGVWRVESHGFNAAIELPDVAEFLAQAGGYVNGWLSLEQRTSVEQTAQGPKTRHYMVPIIEVDVTPAQLMAGAGRVAAPALSGGPVGERPALAAAGPDYVALAADATTADEVRQIWRTAAAAGHLTDGLAEHLKKRAAEVTAPAALPSAADDDAPVEAEVVDEAVPDAGDDPDAIWMQIVAEGGRQGFTTEGLREDFAQAMGGVVADSASAAELGHYLGILRSRATGEAASA